MRSLRWVALLLVSAFPAFAQPVLSPAVVHDLAPTATGAAMRGRAGRAYGDRLVIESGYPSADKNSTAFSRDGKRPSSR